MKYALIKDGVVINIIWLSPSNETDFQNVVKTNGLNIQAGDTYVDGVFYRNGERLLAPGEETEQMLSELLGGVEDVQYE